MLIEGIITAMVTPMDVNQKIDYEATKRHIDFLIDKGVHGLFILGTNGEFHVLSYEEKIEFARVVVNHVAKRVAVYVGAGECGTYETIRLAQAFEAIGADAISVITPYLVKINQAELEMHYTMVAKSVNIPIILYNIPANTGINIEASTLESLMNIENIKGIKDSSGNLDTIKAYLSVIGDKDFSLLIGSDSKILEGLILGAKGAVASTSNAIPEHIVSLYNAYKSGNIENALMLQKDVDVIRGVLKLATIPSIVKRCVSLRGNNVGEARYPVMSINDKYDRQILEMLSFYKLI